MGLRNGKKEWVPLSQSLSNPAASTKTHWTLLETIYSGKKIALPLLIKDQLIAGFR